MFALRTTAIAKPHAIALVAVAEARWDDARTAFRAAISGLEALANHFHRSLAGLQFDAYLGQRFEDARQAGTDAEAFFVSVDAAEFPARYRATFRGTPAPPAEEAIRAPAAPRAAVPVDAEQPA